MGRWWRAVGATLIASSLLVGASAARAADEPPAQGTAHWAVLLEAGALYAGPGEDTDGFGLLKALSPVQVLGYDGDWAYIYEPRARGTAYVHADLLGPSDPPSPYLLMRPPEVEEPFAERGLLTSSAPLAVYPTEDDEAAEARLQPNTLLRLDP